MKSEETKVRTVFFDVDGVLIHGYHACPELRQCWDKNIFEDFGITQEKFKQEFILGPFIQEVIIGKKDLYNSLSETLPRLGFNGDPQILIDYWLKNDSNINYDLIEKIKILKQSGKVKLFIVTNQEHNRAHYLMNELGFNQYFDDIFYSARIGSLKPAREYFEYISNSLQLSKDLPPIFFDDTPNVVTGAKDFGWEAIEFIDVASLNNHKFIKELLE